MIEIDNFTLRGHEDTPILRSFSTSITSGDLAVLTGPSGCGKSSLLKAIAGLHTRWSGTIRVNGLELTPKSASGIRHTVGYIPQEPSLPEGTVEEFFELFVPGFAGDRTLAQNAQERMERLYLSGDIMNKTCSQLSGGERQRVAIAAVTLLDRPIILADEITSALDPQSRGEVISFLTSQDKTILSVSHDSEWIAAMNRTIDLGGAA